MEHVYGIGEDVSDTAIEVLVSRLRKKIAPFGIEIKMARGLGYYLGRQVMLFFQSLRLRLLALILIPLLLVASLAIGWQYKQSTLSAETVFDQKLSIMALAIFRDLLATGGESLSPATNII